MSDENKENLNDQQKRRDVVAGPVWKLKTESNTQLSPISEIVATLGEASIATPKTTKQKTSKVGKFWSRKGLKWDRKKLWIR